MYFNDKTRKDLLHCQQCKGEILYINLHKKTRNVSTDALILQPFSTVTLYLIYFQSYMINKIY